MVATPPLETEAAAQKSRRDVSGDHRRLDRQGAGAAHRVHERTRRVRPACAQQHGRRDVLPQGRDAALGPVPPAMKTLPREIQTEDGALPGKVEVEPDVRIVPVHRGAPARDVAEVVGHPVLDHLGGVPRVGDRRRRPRAVHHEGRRGAHVILPVYLTDRGVHVLRRRRGESGQRHEHSDRHARPEAGAVRRFQRSPELHAQWMGPDLGGPEALELRGEEFFGMARPDGVEFQIHGWVGFYAEARRVGREHDAAAAGTLPPRPLVNHAGVFYPGEFLEGIQRGVVHG